MKSYHIIIALIIFVIHPTITIAKQAPEKIKESSFNLSINAQKFTEKHQARNLVNDQYFVSALKQILTSDLSEIEKVDAFIITLDKINWLFNGTMRLFPEKNYFETYTLTIATYIEYQRALKSLNYDINKLVAITKPNNSASTIQKANALLLATIANPKDATTHIKSLCNSGSINSSDVPAIMLHNLSMSVALARDIGLALNLLDIISSVNIEEGKEDILCAAGFYNNSKVIEGIKTYIKNNFIQKIDNSIQTGLIIILNRSSKKDFLFFLKELDSLDKKSTRKKDIAELKRSGFRGPLQSLQGKKTWTKTWDNFNIAIYDDGVHVTYGNFSHFHKYINK